MWMWAFVKFAAADITGQRFFTRFTMFATGAKPFERTEAIPSLTPKREATDQEK